MALSEYIRLMYLGLSENIEVRFLTKPIMMGIAGGFIIVYIVVIILQVIRWLVEYE
jgi:hypothetical protein